jgi:probable HAF family extracellular repeat protein
MRQTFLSLAVSLRATIVFFVALAVGAIALLSLSTKPAESQQAPAQPRYAVKDLGTFGGTYSVGQDINNSNQVVGYAATSDDASSHAFLYSGGQMKDLDALGGPYSSSAEGINDAGKVVGIAGSDAFLYDGTMHDLGTPAGGTYSWAMGINNSDQVVGYWGGDDFYGQHAFLYDGTMHDLGTLGGVSSDAEAINDAGKITGYYVPSADDYMAHAFLYDGTMHDLGTLGGTYSHGWDINNSGQVVGGAAVSDTNLGHAFLYDGTMHDLGTLGGTFDSSSAQGINNLGQVVGYSEVSDTAERRAILYSDGVMQDLNSLIPADSGWNLQEAKAINDNGYIVGVGFNKDGQQHAFLLIPSTFEGFYQPVDNLPTLNKTKAGSAIPVKFSLGGDKGLDIFAAGYPKSRQIDCDSTAPLDAIEETATAGSNSLSYDATTDRYTYVWKTDKAWANTCRQLVVKLADDTEHLANFKFVK